MTTRALVEWSCESCSNHEIVPADAVPNGWFRLVDLDPDDPRSTDLCWYCSRTILDGIAERKRNR